MVMKINGKVHNISMMKMYLDDEIYDMLDKLTKVYAQPTNKHCMALLISHTYLALVQQGKILDEKARAKAAIQDAQARASEDASKGQVST